MAGDLARYNVPVQINRSMPPASSLFDELLPIAVDAWTNPGSRIHGPDHWRRVCENGLELATRNREVEIAVVQTFAAFHDSQRRNDGHDPQHGARAADLARTLDLPLNAAQLEVLCAALVDHDRGLVSDDPTIGACWDGDRLDLVRLGRQPRPELMSTAAGKRLANQRHP